MGSKPTSRPNSLIFAARALAQPATKPASTSPEAPAGVFAGTSGWAYATWKPGFYPAGVAAKRFLEYYGSQLNSVEVNYTFRALPTAKTLEGWLAAVPAGFRFSFKAPQRVTHFKRLLDCDVLVEQFVTALEPVRAAGKLGLLLFQLPSNFAADAARLKSFLAIAALRGADAPRLAFEFRHASWFAEETYSLLREHNAALCIAESDDLRTPEVHTAADFTCYRLRREGGYKPAEIAAFAERFAALAQQREVYAYFKHEDEPTGALNAVACLRAVEGR